MVHFSYTSLATVSLTLAIIHLRVERTSYKFYNDASADVLVGHILCTIVHHHSRPASVICSLGLSHKLEHSKRVNMLSGH